MDALNEVSKKAEGAEGRPVYGAVLAAIKRTATRVYDRTDNTKVAIGEIPKAEKTIPLTNAPNNSINVSSLTVGAMVYTQVKNNDEASFNLGKKIVGLLEKSGVLASDIERIDSSKIPKQTQVRYFNDNDKEKAEQLATFVSEQITEEVHIVRPPNLKTKPGVLEVWISGKN